MIRTKLDKPPDQIVPCRLCGEPLKVTYYWIEVVNRWMRPSCHDKCIDQWEASRNLKTQTANAPERVMPKRFRELDLSLLPDQKAVRQVLEFNPDSKLRTLAIIGHQGLGKSRLMWKLVEQFFDEVGYGWPEYAIFPDIMTDFDRILISRLKIARWAFVDDIGSIESFGRDRGMLQGVIRARVQHGKWTFLTIDNPEFDVGFEDLFRDRAVVVYLK